MSICSVPGCFSKSTAGFAVFNMPEPATKMKFVWMEYLRSCGMRVSCNKNYKICELHFDKSHFKAQGRAPRRLLKHAYPVKLSSCNETLSANDRVFSNAPKWSSKLIANNQAKATVITQIRNPIQIYRVRHEETKFGRFRTTFDERIIDVLSVHQNGANEIVKLSKSGNFKTASLFKDLNVMYQHLSALCTASKNKLDELQMLIKADMGTLSTWVDEDEAVMGRKSSQRQKVEDDEEVVVIEQPTETVEVLSGDDEPSVEEAAQYEASEHDDGTEFMVIEKGPSFVDNSARDELIPYQEILPSTSGQNVEVFQGFTIETVFEPEIKPEPDCQPGTSMKQEPIDSGSNSAAAIPAHQPNPLYFNRSRLLHDNLRQKLQKAGNQNLLPTTLAKRIKTRLLARK